MSEPTNDNKALATMSGLTSGTGVMSTAKNGTHAERKMVLTALLNAESLSEHLGEVIEVKDIVAQVVTVNDATNDEPRDVVRTVILAANGKSYFTTSDSIISSFRDVFAVLGQPSEWETPLPIVISEEKGSRAGRKFFRLNLAE